MYTDSELMHYLITQKMNKELSGNSLSSCTSQVPLFLNFTCFWIYSFTSYAVGSWRLNTKSKKIPIKISWIFQWKKNSILYKEEEIYIYKNIPLN